MLKKKLAVLGVALGILAMGAPAAAFAETDDTYTPYVLPAAVTIENPVITPCETASIVFGTGYWLANETVQVTASGARVGGASFTPSVAASTDGSLTATFQPPADGDGVYDITFSSATQSYTAPITVTGGRDAAASCQHDPVVDQSLALTGGGTSPWLYGVGGGLLVAGSALITVTVLRRRRA
jgi:hypothetical protein